MKFYFAPAIEHEVFKGGKRATIVTTLNRDIERAKKVCPNLLKEFKFIRKHSELLCSHGDLTTLRDEAMNRDNWKRLVENITYAAEATRPVSGIEA